MRNWLHTTRTCLPAAFFRCTGAVHNDFIPPSSNLAGGIPAAATHAEGQTSVVLTGRRHRYQACGGPAYQSNDQRPHPVYTLCPYSQRLTRFRLSSADPQQNVRLVLVAGFWNRTGRRSPTVDVGRCGEAKSRYDVCGAALVALSALGHGP
jgi:hypothetical protein